MTTKSRLEELLRAAGRAVPKEELTRALQVTDQALHRAVFGLRREFEIIGVRQGRELAYQLGAAKASAVVSFTLPADLWRGWRHHETGVAPDRLG